MRQKEKWTLDRRNSAIAVTVRLTNAQNLRSSALKTYRKGVPKLPGSYVNAACTEDVTMK